MYQFDYFNPVKIVFGRGKFSRIGTIAKTYGKKALIATYPGSHFAALTDRLREVLAQAGMGCAVFDKVPPNPIGTVGLEGAALANESGCDVVIGLGGGSAMDMAKGIAVLAPNGGPVFDYITGGKAIPHALPILVVPTTAGTGSEGNCIAVFTNSETKVKKGIINPKIYAKAAILDPELLTTLPPRNIAGPGADALFHAIESYIAVNRNPYTKMLSRQAIVLISQNLPNVYKDNSDLDSWEKVAFGSLLAGIAIGPAGTTLAHALGHPLGGLLNITHSDALAAVYEQFMLFTYGAALQDFADIARIMEPSLNGANDAIAAEASVCLVMRLLDSVNLRPKLRGLGVSPDHLRWLSNEVVTTMDNVLTNNPVVPNREDVLKMYQASM